MSNKSPRCVGCKQIFSDRHWYYHQLCQSCGDFNYDKQQATTDASLSQISMLPENEVDPALFPIDKYDREGNQIDLRSINIWLLRDDEVSIVELLEVHVVNAISPFVINSRLKGMMTRNKNIDKYIINVSSQEGRFNGVEKPWRHPHTNMAKAALNQMTRTWGASHFLSSPHPKSLSLRERDFKSGSLLPEGEGLGMRAVNLRQKSGMLPRTCAKEYAKHRILMNAVDPGWISFQHPHPIATEMIDRIMY